MRDLFGFNHDFNSNKGAISMPNRLQPLPIHDNGSSFAVPIAFSTVAPSRSPAHLFDPRSAVQQLYLGEIAKRTSGVGCVDCDCGRSPAGLVGSAQPDIGLARLVAEI